MQQTDRKRLTLRLPAIFNREPAILPLVT